MLVKGFSSQRFFIPSVHEYLFLVDIGWRGVTEKYHLYVNFIILYILHILGSPNTTVFGYMTRGCIYKTKEYYKTIQDTWLLFLEY